MRTMAQKRAEFALARVLFIKDKKDFQSFSAGAPSMILQNGFGQTLAFWLAKSKSEKSEHMALFDISTRWLKQTDMKHFGDCRQPKDYIQKLSTMEQREYLNNQNETLALLEWVKRFANADLS